jgi:hypothetical protein
MSKPNLFEIDSLADFPRQDFNLSMQKHSYACFRGLINTESIYQSLLKINAVFDCTKDFPATGQNPDAIRHNFQKLTIGGESRTASNDDARFFRVFYNPLWEEDIYGLRNALTVLAKFRNVIANLPIDFAIEKTEANGLWTAARFHQYPAGGGFFRRHTDYIVKDIADEKSTEFYQVVLTMSQKGDHFNEGGAFVDIGDQRICLDDFSMPGDIIVYDGRTVHGVEDIDPANPLDLTTINGRLAGFVTLYKKM